MTAIESRKVHKTNNIPKLWIIVLPIMVINLGLNLKMHLTTDLRRFALVSQRVSS